MIPRSRPIPQQPAPPLPGRMRMAGDDPMVQQLLMADKYRYLEPGDYPSTEAEAAAYADHLSGLEDFLEDRIEYQRALEGADMTGQPIWWLPAEVEREYEQGVAQRLAQLQAQHPAAVGLDLLGEAI